MHNVLVISVDDNFLPWQDVAKLLHCFHNGQEFLFTSCAILLGFVHFLTVEGQWFPFLGDHCT